MSQDERESSENPVPGPPSGHERATREERLTRKPVEAGRKTKTNDGCQLLKLGPIGIKPTSEPRRVPLELLYAYSPNES